MTEKNTAAHAGAAKHTGDLLDSLTVSPREAPVKPEGSDVIAWAIYYGLLGYSVFPCAGKRPRLLKGTSWKSVATKVPAAIRQMFRTGDQIGVVIPDGVVVIDGDVLPTDGETGDSAFKRFSSLLKNLGVPIYTNSLVYSVTGKGGFHLWYQTPVSLGNATGGLPAGFDVRGGGRGYTIEPPSKHENGRLHYWSEKSLPFVSVDSLPTIPDALLELIRNPKIEMVKPKPTTQPTAGSSRLERVTASEILKLNEAGIGERNTILNKAAFTLAGIATAEGATAEQIERTKDSLAVEGISTGLSPREVFQTINSGWEKGELSPLKPEPKLTDVGNAERFVDWLGGRARYCPEKRSWLIFDKFLWSWDTTGRIVELAKEFLRWWSGETYKLDDEKRRDYLKHILKIESANRLHAMIGLAQSVDGVPVHVAELDSNLWILNCKNGVHDLLSGELRAPRMADLITKSTHTVFDPEARSELWERCLLAWTGGDSERVAYLRRCAGYLLSGSVQEKALFFLFGAANGGKSRFLDALLFAMGDYAQVADFDTWIRSTIKGTRNRGDLTDLAGARLVVSDETYKGAVFDESLLKKIAGGGGRIKAAAKYQAEQEFEVTFKLVLAANDAPAFPDGDTGLWDRMRRIPFDNIIPPGKRDRGFREKLRAHDVRSAVLAWASRGFKEWHARGLGTCSAVEASNEAYRREMDRFGGFLEEYVLFDNASRTRVTEIRLIYETWCNDEGVPPLRVREFNERLRKAGATPSRKDGQKAWAGIRLKNPMGFDLVETQDDVVFSEGYTA